MTEESFLGTWYTIKGDLEAYSFLKDEKAYIFVGTRGPDPVIFGTWKLEDDKFVISVDNGNTTEYSFVLSNDTLFLNDGMEIYTRTQPVEVKYPEVQILIALARDMDALEFSKPVSADLNWGYLDTATNKVIEFLLTGFAITAESTISSGTIQKVSDYLSDHGFEPDTSYIASVCHGYWDSNQIITICTSKNPEATNDSINIMVTSGLIVK